MPRHLRRAIDALAALAPCSENRWLLEEDAPRRELGGYWRVAWAFHRLDIEVAAPLRREIAALWKARRDLRRALEPMVLNHPCDEFLGPLHRSVERAAYDG